jgi:hypothetical protein
MNKMCAAFKLALRYYKQHEHMMRTGSYSKNLSENEFGSFWSSIHKKKKIMLN